MNCTKQHLIDCINTVGAPDYSSDLPLPRKLQQMAEWFFVNQYPESEPTSLVREALLELDHDACYLTFRDS